MKCPICETECKAMQFGEGWVVICKNCKKVLYNSEIKPKEERDETVLV
jgi:hypothetical protein